MKRYYIVLAILGPLLIIGGVIGLVRNKTVSDLPPTPPTPPAPALTSEQVISRIQVYGLPRLKEYGEHGDKNPVGQWAAVYEGGGQWRVRGAVVVQTMEWIKDRDSINPFRGTYVSREYYYSTTWLYRRDGQIELVDFSD